MHALHCHPKKKKPIQGEGNCLFRALSYVITGSEKHHLQVRANILEHMESIASLILGHIRGRSNAMHNCSSVKEYIELIKGGGPFFFFFGSFGGKKS